MLRGEPRRELTSRQKQIMYLVAQGYTNFGISVLLKVSEQTVKNHLTTVYLKLGARNRASAVYLMGEKGYTFPES